MEKKANMQNVIPNGTCASEVRLLETKRGAVLAQKRVKDMAPPVTDRYAVVSILESTAPARASALTTYSDIVKAAVQAEKERERAETQAMVNDIVIYGNNPYRVHNPADKENCAVFLDFLGLAHLNGLDGSFKVDDPARREYWPNRWRRAVAAGL